MVSMSVSQTGASNSAGAGGTGMVTVFLFAGGVVWLSETWCVSVVCGMASVAEADEDDGEEMSVGTEAGLTEIGKVTAGGCRRR